jgi:hypothetical protein
MVDQASKLRSSTEPTLRSNRRILIHAETRGRADMVYFSGRKSVELRFPESRPDKADPYRKGYARNANARKKSNLLDGSYWGDYVWNAQRPDVGHKDKLARDGRTHSSLRLLTLFRAFEFALFGFYFSPRSMNTFLLSKIAWQNDSRQSAARGDFSTEGTLHGKDLAHL